MDDGIPQVDGLRLIARLDEVESVGRGEVWSARATGGLAGDGSTRLPGDLPGVGECCVRLLRMPVDQALRARAQRLARDLQALSDPGLVPIRAVAKAYDGVALVYGNLPPSATGLHLLARRRMLRTGEIVTLGVALCWALAHAHAAGIVHGRLADADVLIGGDGRPVLTGVGVLGVMGAAGEPEDDVRALGRLLASLLDRESAGAGRVMKALAEGRSTAADLAVALASAAPATAIGVEDPAPGAPEADRGRRTRSRRRPRIRRPGWVRPRVLLAAAGVVLLGVLAGWASAPAHHASGARPLPAAPAIDWRTVMARLDTGWAAGFERPTAGFAAVDAPAGPAYRSDEAAAASLRAHGVHAVGLRLVLVDVVAEAASPQRVSLRVTDQRPAYELRDASGKPVRRVGPRPAATHHIELQLLGSPGAWRIARVSS